MRDSGHQKEKFDVCICVSGTASGVVHSPTVEPLEHVRVSLATPGTEACDAVGGALRPEWREWPATES